MSESRLPTNFGYLDDPARHHFSRKLLPYRQFALAAALQPDKPALIAADRVLTYRSLLDVTDRLASGLVALGLNPGEAAAIVLEDRWEHLPLFLALARIGGVHVTINPANPEAHVRAELDELGPRLHIGRGGIRIEAILAAAGPALPDIFDDEHAPLAIRYSSGTTGNPKKTIASQRAQAFVYRALATELQLTSDDVHLAIGSLAHAALQTALAQLMVGGSVIVHPFDPATAWLDCERFGITNVMLMPTMLAMALEHPHPIQRPVTICTMGAALAPPLKRKLAACLDQARLHTIYASTELGFLTSLKPSEHVSKPDSAGRAHFGTEIAIFDDAGNALPIGQTGNIHGRGPMAVSAFIGRTRPDPAPDRFVADGWIASGDIGFLDGDGFLYIRDRQADLIICAGELIFPSEIEAVIVDVAGVRDVAVIGIPDPRLGHRVAAYVEGKAAPELLAKTCIERLAPNQHPHAIFQVESLPRTTSAKISRHLVRRAVAEGRFPS